MQEALIGDDHSLTNAWIVIVTFLFLDNAMSVLKQRLQAGRVPAFGPSVNFSKMTELCNRIGRKNM